jgi:hypothetical protein
MSAVATESTAFGGAPAAAKALALLDALARAPAAAAAAAALVVTALERAEDLRALRLVHPQLRDAVGEATTELDTRPSSGVFPRTPTSQRWPRLEELNFCRMPIE